MKGNAKDINLKSLLKAFSKGDVSAFESFYKETYNDFYAYGLHFEKDVSLVKDIVQNFYLLVFDHPETYLASGALKPYLIRCFRNYLLRYKSNEDKEKAQRYSHIKDTNVSSPEEEICSKETRNNRKELGESILNLLSPREREIIFLRYYKNLSAKEVARTLNISYQVVRNLTARGISKIRNRFSSREELINRLHIISQNIILLFLLLTW